MSRQEAMTVATTYKDTIVELGSQFIANPSRGVSKTVSPYVFTVYNSGHHFNPITRETDSDIVVIVEKLGQQAVVAACSVDIETGKRVKGKWAKYLLPVCKQIWMAHKLTKK